MRPFEFLLEKLEEMAPAAHKAVVGELPVAHLRFLVRSAVRAVTLVAWEHPEGEGGEEDLLPFPGRESFWRWPRAQAVAGARVVSPTPLPGQRTYLSRETLMEVPGRTVVPPTMVVAAEEEAEVILQGAWEAL